MNRRHALVISIFLALALVAGLLAGLRTTHLGARSSAAPAPQLAAKSRQLDRYEAALRREAQKRPPALPPVPAAAAPARHAAAAPPVQTIYRRPPAIVHVVHRQHEAGHETEHESGELDD
jgi:predicted lipid-binding transport protein (Tim44 family)